jgi:hypothetical protein
LSFLFPWLKVNLPIRSITQHAWPEEPWRIGRLGNILVVVLALIVSIAIESAAQTHETTEPEELVAGSGCVHRTTAIIPHIPNQARASGPIAFIVPEGMGGTVTHTQLFFGHRVYTVVWDEVRPTERVYSLDDPSFVRMQHEFERLGAGITLREGMDALWLAQHAGHLTVRKNVAEFRVAPTDITEPTVECAPSGKP